MTIRQVRTLPAVRRIYYVKYLRILYPRAQRILDEFRYCMRANGVSNDPKCKLLVGPSGVGKSTLLQIILEDCPRIFTETETIVPAFIATVDSPATTGSLASRLLEGLGDPRFDKGTIANRIFRVERLITDCQTKMVMVDEIQHLVDRDSKKIMQTVTDALKNLIKSKQLVCILSGLNGEAEQVVDSNPQLARLFSDPIVLEPFKWDESKPETVKEFRTLLAEIEKLLPLRENSNLHRKELAWRIFVATDGLMAFTMTLIREATLKALEHGQEALDESLFAEVFDKELSPKRRVLQNPFVGEIPEYKLPDVRRKSVK